MVVKQEKRTVLAQCERVIRSKIRFFFENILKKFQNITSAVERQRRKKYRAMNRTNQIQSKTPLLVRPFGPSVRYTKALSKLCSTACSN
jgi:hypothetical protein